MCKGQKNAKSTHKWRYSVIPEKGYDIDIGHFNTYGIQLTGPCYSEVIHDVSIYEEAVVYMANLFNKGQLASCHFRDLIDDMAL